MQKTYKLQIIFFIFSICSSKILRLPACGKFHAYWTKIYDGKKLQHSHYSLVSGVNYEECVVKCMYYPKCKSVSIKENMCMLHHNRHDEDDTLLLSEESWTHVETDNMTKNLGPFCARNMPCQHGTCEDTCDNNGYKCTCYENDWELQAGHVCFGAKGNNYGSIILRSTGVLTKLRLLHTGEASLNCNMHRCSSGSKWGCCVTAGEIYIIITNKENEIIAPETMPKRYSYKLPGFDQNSAFIQFDVYNTTVKVGDELRIWHLQDIKDKSEYNNEGRSCANVYAVFCD